MKWSDNGGSKDFASAPAGTHVARCVKLIDIGTQAGEYQGQPTFRRQVVITFELSNELMPDGEYAGQPFTVSKYYTASLHEKAGLRKDLVNWRGREFTDEELKGFESKNILGKPCMIQLTPNDKGKVRITGVMSLPKGTTAPDQMVPSFYFSLERDEFSHQAFDGLSDYYKELIAKSPEFVALQNKPDPVQKPGSPADFDDDIPF